MERPEVSDELFLDRGACNIARNELRSLFIMADAREAELVAKVQGLVQKGFAAKGHRKFAGVGSKGRRSARLVRSHA